MAILNVAGLAEDKGVVFPSIPAGKYPVVISKVEMGESSPTAEKCPSAPMLKVIFKVSGGEHTGEQLFEQIVIPDQGKHPDVFVKGRAKLKRLANACGLQVTDTFDTDDLYMKALQVVVSKTTRDGKDKNNVEDYLAE